MKSARWSAALAVSLFFTLAACGGGGGGGETSAPAPPAPAPAAIATGLIPTAPNLGATLEADASVLRPVRDGGVWRYRGTKKSSAGAVSRIYDTATTQTLIPGSGKVTEATTNGADGGADTTQLSVVVGGSVSTEQSDDFAGKGLLQRYTQIELRSPVRQGDQITILEKRYVDTAYDIDRDGRNDVLDVAIYSRVIGNETVALTDLPSLTAVRVDTTLRLRFTSSVSGVVGPVTEVTVQSWYAPRIGLVRQVATPPAGNAGNDNLVIEEELVSWDGVSTGFGAMVTTDAVAAGEFAGESLTKSSKTELRAFAFANHALVFSGLRSGVGGIAASSFDLRGRVTGTVILDGVSFPPNSMIAQLSNGLVAVNDSPTMSPRRQFTRLATNGSLVGVTTVELGGDRPMPSVFSVSIAGDGDRIWLIYQRQSQAINPPFTYRSETVLRAYSADGEPLTPEFFPAGVPAGKIHAQGGRLLLTWDVSPSGDATTLALIDTRTGQVGSITTVADTQRRPASVITPLLLNSGSAAVWNAMRGGQPQPYTSALRFDAALNVLATNPPLEVSQINGLPVFSRVAPVALGSRIVFASPDLDSSAQTGGQAKGAARVSWLDAGPVVPLTAAALSSVRFTPPTPTDPIAQAVFADRALVFSGEDFLRSTLVWLNNGKVQ